MAKITQYNVKWAEADDSEVGDLVVSTVERLAEAQSHRRDNAKLWLSAYLGRHVSDLDGRVYTQPQGSSKDAPPELTVRVVQSVVDTAVAKIAAKQRPKPMVLTTNADYRTRLRAKKLSQFLLAQLHQRHGQYSNAWELGHAVFRDACVWDSGAIKVRADESLGRVVYERCFSYDIYVDDQEARDGCPRNLFHRFPYDRSTLIARFPDSEQAIAEAKPWKSEDGSLETESDQIAIYEAWRLPYSQDLPGRHTIAIQSIAGHSTLIDEDWHHDNFPFATIRYLPNQFGLWGQPLVDQIVQPQAEMQAAYCAIQQHIEALGGGYIDVERGAYELAHLQSSSPLKILERKEGSSKAEVHMPNALNQGIMQWAQHWRDACYELTGVNQMMSMGQKEPGVTSGVAIRSINDLQGERFLPMSRSYEQLFVDLGDLTLQAMVDLEESLGEDGKSISIVFPHDGFLTEIKWSDVRMDDQMYRVSIEPASSFPDTLAGRLQLLSELAQSSWISPETAKRLTLQGAPDFESLQRREDSQHRWVERIISKFQEAKEDDEDVYRAPDPLLPSIPMAIAEFAMAYCEMQCDDAPEHNLELMRRWIVDADRLLQKQQPPAPPQAPPADPAMMQQDPALMAA